MKARFVCKMSDARLVRNAIDRQWRAIARIYCWKDYLSFKGKVYGYSSPSEEMTQSYTPEPEQSNIPDKQEKSKTSSLTDDDYDLILEKLIRDRQQRKRKEKDLEM